MKVKPVIIAPNIYKESLQFPHIGMVHLIVFAQNQVFAKCRFDFLVVVFQPWQLPAHQPGNKQAAERDYQSRPHQ